MLKAIKASFAVASSSPDRLRHAALTSLTSLLLATRLLPATAAPASPAPQLASLPVLSTPQLQQVIRNGVAWLVNTQTRTGHYHYEYAPYWDRYTLDDNMVRQTGVYYLLGEVLARDKGNLYSFNIKNSMLKALAFYQRHTVDGELDGRKFKCLLKIPGKCSLGGTSLALAGSLRLIQKFPELKSQLSPIIEAYKDYHVAMKVPGKGFRVAYFPGPGKKQSETELSFSNGEAYLALARYSDYRPTPEVKAVLDDAFKYYNVLYTQNPDNNFYLWGMAAIKDLVKSDAYKASRAQYIQFVKTYTEKRILPYKKMRGTAHNVAAYVEGITSAYSVIEGQLTPAEKQALLEEINFWLSRTSQLQIGSTTLLRTQFPNQAEITLKPRNPRLAVGGFLTGFNEPYQRIDFTQHAVSAYLQKLTDIDKLPI